MAYIESHQTLKDHPKARRLARTLGIGLPQTIGHLHCLWWWCMTYAQDGELTRFENEELAGAALWEGEPESFVRALTDCGFLDSDEDGNLSVHDWYEYAGRLIEMRRADAERKRRDRAAKTGQDSDVRRMSGGSPADVQEMSEDIRRKPKHEHDPKHDHEPNKGGAATRARAHEGVPPAAAPPADFYDCVRQRHPGLNATNAEIDAGLEYLRSKDHEALHSEDSRRLVGLLGRVIREDVRNNGHMPNAPPEPSDSAKKAFLAQMERGKKR